MQVLATNELDLGASMGTGGFKGEVRYAGGPHAGELIIRTKNVYPTTFTAINAVGAVVDAAKEMVRRSETDVLRIDPLDEHEYAEELKRQFREEIEAAKRGSR
jgi:hypothetical protein